MIDAQGRIWFAEFAADRLGMFDTKTEKIREWRLPTPWTAPYDAALDKDGMLWSGGMASDRVQRLDPGTGKAIEYLLPHQTNIRVSSTIRPRRRPSGPATTTTPRSSSSSRSIERRGQASAVSRLALTRRRDAAI